MKIKRSPRPTEYQSQVLRRIAQAGGALVLTLSANKPPQYTDLSGATVPSDTAAALIRNRWVTPERDSMFDLSPQSWRVRTPP
jgi:hypothetical protein